MQQNMPYLSMHHRLRLSFKKHKWKFIKYWFKFSHFLIWMRKYLIKELDWRPSIECQLQVFDRTLYSESINPALLFCQFLFKLRRAYFNCTVLHQAMNTCISTAGEDCTDPPHSAPASHQRGLRPSSDSFLPQAELCLVLNLLALCGCVDC